MGGQQKRWEEIFEGKKGSSLAILIEKYVEEASKSRLYKAEG